MKVYAIRHIPTGRFMPVPTGKNGSGSSYWDPAADDATAKLYGEAPRAVPRLFPLRRSASAALTQWLRGRHEPLTEWEHDETFGSSYQVTVGTDVKHDPSRKADDLEIVAFELVEVGK